MQKRSEQTRLTILETGAAIVHKKGFNNTGIQEILKAAGVPKGSFYYYFEDKEAFGLELIDYYGEFFRKHFIPVLENTSVPPLPRLRQFFDILHQRFRKAGYALGCPVGNLAQEMGDLSPAFEAKLSKAIDGMAMAIKPVLDEAVSRNDLKSSINTMDTAYFIISSWHGAIVRMKVAKHRAPMDIFMDTIFQKILV